MPRPSNLGLQPNGRLQDCGPKPNCVCSCATRASQSVPPIPLLGTAEESYTRMLELVSNMRGATIVEQIKDNYIRAEFRSRIFRFVDDVEIAISETEQLIHMRSASRIGRGDLGVNRRRLVAITQRFIEPSLSGVCGCEPKP